MDTNKPYVVTLKEAIQISTATEEVTTVIYADQVFSTNVTSKEVIQCEIRTENAINTIIIPVSNLLGTFPNEDYSQGSES